MSGKRKDQDFYDEIEAHLRLEVEQLISEGMDPGEAALAARRAFGNVTSSRERFYESNRVMWLETLVRTSLYALRQMMGAPVSTAVILISLTLGVGLNTSMFSLTDQALARSLPIPQPESLVQLQWEGTFVLGGSGMGNVGYGHLIPFPLFRKLEREAPGLEKPFARSSARVHLGTQGGAQPVNAELVTGSFFSSLGIQPALGRLIDGSDDRSPDGHPQVVLSNAFWQSQFGGDPDILGEAVRINGFPMTIIGVAAPGFYGMDWGQPTAVWIPMMMKARVTSGWTGFEEHRARFAQVYARLPIGATREQIQQRLAPWFQDYLLTDTQRSDWPVVTEDQLLGFLDSKLRLLSGAQGQAHLAKRMERPMLILLGAAGLVLLLGCLNVANLSLARALTRRRATALRTALGASRRHILGESLVESAIFAVLGTGLGALSAPWVSRFTLALLLEGTSGRVAISANLSGRVLLFTVVLTGLITILAGMAPAFFAASVHPIGALRQGGAGAAHGVHLRKVLVVGQFALALILLIGAGLFARTLGTLRSGGPGYPTDNLLMFRISPANDGYDRVEAKVLLRRIQERLRQLPDTAEVGLAAWEMLTGGGWNNPVTVATAGGRIATDQSLPMNGVTPGFFDALGVSLLYGRAFTAGEVTSDKWAPSVAIVNQEFVDRYLEGASPLGDHLAFGTAPDADPRIEIVGVVQSFRDFRLREPEAMIFFPLWQLMPDNATFFLRTRTASETAGETLRKSIRDLDPALTVLSLRTLDDQLDRLLLKERLLATLVSTFAILATLLAMIGLFGVLSFSAERRTKEMGIRRALGATRWSTGALILREAMALALTGLAVALPASWALGRLIDSQLFGVTSTDLSTIAIASTALLFVALGAAALPAFKIGQLRPLDVLRRD